MPRPDHPFWKVVDLPEGRTALGRVGRLELYLHHRAREWWLTSRQSDGEEAPRLGEWRGEELLPEELASSDSGLRRHLFRRAPDAVEVRPALADRPVVVRPVVPTSVGPHEEATVFVGTPLWVEVMHDQQALARIPIDRPSDTWFGPSSRQGRLCYAARSRARLRIDALDPLADRALTQVTIRNQGGEALSLDRFSLPVPVLSLFSGRDGWLWTETVTLTREEGQEMARLEVETEPPGQAASGERLRGPHSAAADEPRFLAFGAKALGALLRAP